MADSELIVRNRFTDLLAPDQALTIFDGKDFIDFDNCRYGE